MTIKNKTDATLKFSGSPLNAPQRLLSKLEIVVNGQKWALDRE
jgi:hypothetical protein